MQPTDLAGLDAAGVAYQAIENPYALTLGGQTFDPLEGVPAFGLAMEQKALRSGEPGLHLVQFHGPIKDAWLDDLEKAGLDVIQYIYPFTYVVWGDLDSLSQARSQNTVRWAGDFLPAFAIASKNRGLNSDPLLVKGLIMPQVGLKETVSEIEALGGQTMGTASGVDPAFDLATFLIPGDRLSKIAQLAGPTRPTRTAGRRRPWRDQRPDQRRQLRREQPRLPRIPGLAGQRGPFREWRDHRQRGQRDRPDTSRLDQKNGALQRFHLRWQYLEPSWHPYRRDHGW